MAHGVVFGCRSILVAAVNEAGGTDPLFVNISASNLFRMRVSFQIPSTADPGVMQDIVAVGDNANAEQEAEESASAAVVRLLWQDCNYTVLDYSLLCVWHCIERHSALLIKFEESSSILEDISGQAFEVFESIQSGPMFFLQRIEDMRRSGVDEGIVSSAVSCVAFLQMMHARAGIVRGQFVDRLGAVADHGNLLDFLNTAGFMLPDRESGSTKLGGGVWMMLNQVASLLGYNPPAFRVENCGSRCRCFIEFNGAGPRDFTASGLVSRSVVEATQTAIYNALLAFTVNAVWR